jgi:hypothetical protein
MTVAEGIQRAVERATRGNVRRVELVPIVETFRGEVVWEGVVSVFDTDSGRAYGWAVEGDSEPQFVAVLNKPPVDSPLAAVRAWIASTRKKTK